MHNIFTSHFIIIPATQFDGGLKNGHMSEEY